MKQPVLPEIEETIRKKCSEFLGGPWATAKAKDITIERLGGWVNSNFTATLTKKVANNAVPLKVTVHLYGNEIFGKDGALKYNGEAGEAVITEMLSRKSLAPSLRGVFPGGRIEDFIPSRCLTLSDLEDVTLVSELARKIARFHSFVAPIRKIPDRLQVMLDQVRCRIIPVDYGDAPESDKFYYYKFLNFPLREEITHVSKIMSQIGGKPVFCHGDLNLTNILLRDGVSEEDARITFVDFEICCYFYRAHDFACHFYFRKIVLKCVTDNKAEYEIVNDVNLERDRKLMLEAYLDEWAKLHNGLTCENDTVEHLNMEIDFAQLSNILFHICYCRLMVLTWTDPLRFKNWWKLCEVYFNTKKHVLEKYGDPSVEMNNGKT